jgi:hypothetical protein
VTSVGLWRDANHRYYAKYADTEPVGPMPGVTGVIGIMDKPGVAYWRGTTVAQIIAKDLEFFRKLVETGGAEAAVGWAAKLPGHERDKAADTGSLVHILVEKILRRREVEIPVGLVPYALAFRRYLTDHQPNIASVEQLIWNRAAGYGGTFDFLEKRTDGTWVLWDVKTWKRRPIPGGDMYAETAMQLAAYANADVIGAPDDPKRHRMPPITAHGVLHLRPDLYDSGYARYPFHVTEADYSGFVGLLNAYRWKQERAKVVIGEPLPARELEGAVA